jgi:hypothetical protein
MQKQVWPNICVIKKTNCHPKKVGNFDVWVLIVLLVVALDIEQSMFKLSMKSNAVDAMAKPNDVNLVSRFWRTLSTSRVLSFLFPEYFKLADIHEPLSVVVTCYWLHGFIKKSL